MEVLREEMRETELIIEGEYLSEEQMETEGFSASPGFPLKTSLE